MRTLLLALAACLMLSPSIQARSVNEVQREQCREEARRALKPGRSGSVDREYLKELRREYRRACRQRARGG